MAHLERLSFRGDANLGLYGMATDKYAVLPEGLKFDESVLNVPIIRAKISGVDFLGMFLAGNSNALLVSRIITDRELDSIREQMRKIDPKVKVEIVGTRHNVLGNLITCNDNGAIVSSELEKHFDTIEKLLKVPVAEGKLHDSDLVGSLCTTTNKGFLLTMNATEEEYAFFKKHLKVEGDIGSVNFGGIFVSSGLIANSNGFLVGQMSTGPEVGRIDEALGFV